MSQRAALDELVLRQVVGIQMAAVLAAEFDQTPGEFALVERCVPLLGDPGQGLGECRLAEQLAFPLQGPVPVKGFRGRGGPVDRCDNAEYVGLQRVDVDAFCGVLDRGGQDLA